MSAARYIVEPVIERGIQLAQQHQGIVAAPHIQQFRQIEQRGRGFGELARQHHLGEIPQSDQRVQFVPRSGPERLRNLGQWLLFDQRLGHHHQLRVLPRNIEVMDVVAQVIAIGENPATGADRQGKREAALIVVAARVHARLHEAFAYLVRIQELGQMPYQIKIHRLSNSLLPK